MPSEGTPPLSSERPQEPESPGAGPPGASSPDATGAAPDRHASFKAKARAFMLRRRERLRQRVDGSQAPAPEQHGSQPGKTIDLLGGRNEAIRVAFRELRAGKKPHWIKSLLILAVTVFLFISLGLLGSTVEDILILVGVILVHEMGHFVAMYAFGYQDVRMFFIPLFGAAVSGRQTGVPGLERGIVALMGPLPGLLAGIGFLAAHHVTGAEILARAGIVLLALNAFNLLPLFPMDGGRLLFEAVFCRSRYAELVLRILAAVGLGLLGLALGGYILVVFAVFALIMATHAFKVSSLALRLRREEETGPVPIEASAEGPAEPSDEMLDRIIAEVRKAWPNLTKPKTTAGLVEMVWERLHLRAPGCLAAAVLLVVYGLCLALVLVGMALAPVPSPPPF